ncbi:hypothetical protein PHYBOEH_000388 [Phytophthora boehmeriae]|uniref:Endo-beta-1,6-galactanase-like domain-containing protein n=1 Tax=Phytophthora boehmeriae TaxID=109152 RepID=A0A8T1VBP9_9STRA|nr:hypothetical protein PHYBOEH_000388 [Phytophthora boehmeriae]
MFSIKWLVTSASTIVCLTYQSSLSTADSPVTVSTPPQIKVEATSTGVVWEGWGTSLAWWTNVYGGSEDLAELLFSLSENPLVETTDGSILDLPALGLNIARYNIGGSGSNVIDDGGEEIAMKISNDMPAYKTAESYWLDWLSSDPTTSSWNWTADAGQRTMLSLPTANGVDIIEAYSNSPPWWMTKNRASAGGDKGGDDNLLPENYDRFALYLATVVREAKTRWDINFSYVAPFNEPTSTKWEFPGTQEGCHFSIAAQSEVSKRLRAHLDKLELQSVAVSVSDESSPTAALSTLTDLTANVSVMEAVGKTNTHGYDGQEVYRGEDRAALKKLAADSNLNRWVSEYGDDDGSGLTLAESITLDINELGVSAFVYAQMLNSGSRGLIQSNLWDHWMGEANPKYYVMAHYSRHIRRGMGIHATDDPGTVAAFDAENSVLVIVRVTLGEAETKQIVIEDFMLGRESAFDRWPSRIDTWTTKAKSTDSFYVESGIQDPSLEFNVDFPAESVMTLEVHWG